ncbi:hypothetical protein Mapa_013138 [Marchantia paleacea]|nr:hypothetical protein Mapa_013138 [Marchantia paleacea]
MQVTAKSSLRATKFTTYLIASKKSNKLNSDVLVDGWSYTRLHQEGGPTRIKLPITETKFGNESRPSLNFNPGKDSSS